MKLARGTDYVQRVRQALRLHRFSSPVRRVVVGLLGGAVLAVGCAMLLLPGPAFIVIPLGLLILATEFQWAHRWARKATDMVRRGRRKIHARRVARRQAKASLSR